MPAIELSQVAVHLRPEDNVAVAARALQPGEDLRCDGATIGACTRSNDANSSRSNSRPLTRAEFGT